LKLNEVICADCIEWLDGREPFADLIFADPPFNIGYQYDVYEDRKAYDEYHAWTERWMAACKEVLKPAGSFWIAIGDDYAAEVRLIANKLGLHLRNWVIWHYTFGQQTKMKFARSHTHLFYFVKDPKNFTFDDKAVRTFSDRQREYNDKRANPAGKLPDDTWTEFPRLCGTFAERTAHPCQMPETILARIIRVSSNAGDVVLDPFAGSGTTLAVAKKLSRDYVGIELSPEYVQKMNARLASVLALKTIEIEGERSAWPQEHVQELKALYLDQGLATDHLSKNPELLVLFTQRFNLRIEKTASHLVYAPNDVWVKLERLRKGAKLPRIRVHAKEQARPAARPAPTGLFNS